MRKVSFALAVLLLSACGSKVEGTYSDSLGMSEYTFKSGGKVVLAVMGTKMEMNYTQDGDKVKVGTPQGALVMTVLDDGSIQGPGGMKLTKRK